LLQRKPGKHGESLGKTTGWIHKASLKNRGVEMLSGVTYESIEPQGIRVSYKGSSQLLEVDTVVICAGQESRQELYLELMALGKPVSLVGGASFAGELDAKRAIMEGMKAVAKLAFLVTFLSFSIVQSFVTI
jgi:2,4-dienoyl-CoA reductase (NADPH2)